MSRGVLAALLLALAAPSAAGWRSFAASEPGACGGDQFVFSDDGWHYACAHKTGGPDVLVRNGVPIATLKPSQLSGQFGYESQMSDNGRVVLHQLAVIDEQGTVTGVQAAVNGDPFGPACSDIFFMALTDQGADLAYACRRPEGWRVITAAGTGPALESPPSLAGLGVTGRVAYFVQPPQGAARLYINHARVPEEDLYSVSVAPDMKRRIVFRSNPERQGIIADPGMGAKPEGPFMGAAGAAFAPDGRKYAYKARRNPKDYDTVVVNGARYDCPAPVFLRHGGGATYYEKDIHFSRQGAAAWACGAGTVKTLYLDGKKVVSFSGNAVSAAFTPAGKPAILVDKNGSGAVAGASGVAVSLPRPIHGTRLGFDAEDEFHYYARVDGQVALVCAAFGGKEPRACAAKARKLYRGQ